MWPLRHLQDARKLALTVRNVSSVPPAESDDTLLQVAQRLVYIHAFLLDRLVRDSAPFQSLLQRVLRWSLTGTVVHTQQTKPEAGAEGIVLTSCVGFLLSVGFFLASFLFLGMLFIVIDAKTQCHAAHCQMANRVAIIIES